MKSHRNLAIAFTSAGLMSLGFSGTGHANIVLGDLWVNQTTAAEDATIANIPTTAPDVTFTVNTPIGFFGGYDGSPCASCNPDGGPSGDYTVGGFLGSGGATVLTGSSFLPDALDNTFIKVSGTVSVTTGETFTAGHDDGVTLVIGGTTVIDAPGGTSFVDTTETYTGPTGNEAFTLVYGEAFGAPGALAIDLPLTSGVPEPSTWALMVLGFAGLGFAGYRRGKKAHATVSAT